MTKYPDVLESYIEDRGNKAAKRNGWRVRKVKWIGHRAAPDRFYFKPGTGAFFVEYKKTGQVPRPDQAFEIAQLRSAGMVVHVVDTVEAAEALFEDLLN